MTEEQQRNRTRQIIADAERLIAEVDRTLERGRRVFAERGLDSQSLQKRIDALGPVAKEQLRKHVTEGMRQIDERSREERLRADFAQSSSSRRMRPVRSMI